MAQWLDRKFRSKNYAMNSFYSLFESELCDIQIHFQVIWIHLSQKYRKWETPFAFSLHPVHLLEVGRYPSVPLVHFFSTLLFLLWEYPFPYTHTAHLFLSLLWVSLLMSLSPRGLSFIFQDCDWKGIWRGFWSMALLFLDLRLVRFLCSPY